MKRFCSFRQEFHEINIESKLSRQISQTHSGDGAIVAPNFLDTAEWEP